jgi:hypothetical protein
MTCQHVLDLIDAGPFAGQSPAHLDAAWRHARECATCGPALGAMTALTSDLAALPAPAPPPDLAAAVMARLARLDAAPPVPAPAPPGAWPARTIVLGGLVAVLVVMFLPSPKPFWLTWGRLAVPSPSVAALLLVAGLTLYAGGMFASLADRRGQ